MDAVGEVQQQDLGKLMSSTAQATPHERRGMKGNVVNL